MKQYKTYREKYSTSENDIIDKIDKYHYTTITLNDDDKLVSSLNYSEDGELVYSYKAEYDKDGNIISEERIDKEIGNESKCYKYNDGLLIEEDITNIDGGEEKIIREYNENGDIILQTSYDEDGEIIEKMIYTYKDGLLAKIEYDYDGDITPYQRFYYDDNKNVIKLTETNLDEKDLDTVNEYDDKNRLTKKISYNEYRSIESTETYEYDDKDRVINNIRKSKGSSLIFKFSYLEDNSLLSQEITYANGAPFMLIENTYENGLLSSTKTVIHVAETNSQDIEILTREY